ncbi:PhzF family phenazine biosynthesis protein [Baekduia sp. Peel2402]|uniref:PhzF family phenazine biosynthesis protein n=1 Tax=Baekduia sp. Peel2402 TaxID=3458296 RepID=UPI00403E5829
MASEVVHMVAFADGPSGGNPCPVVLDADDWTTDLMQAAAAGFGHETCFVLAPDDPDAADVRYRYFVPNHEMEMCVHATVAATVLRGRDGVTRVQTPLGVREVRVDGDRAIVEQFPPAFGPWVDDLAPVVAALGGVEPAGRVRAASTSRAKLMVPVADEQTLDALRPDVEALWAACEALDVTGFYPYALLDGDGAGDAAARQFPLRAGYDEDPATGVAACALAAHLADLAATDGRHAFTILQGRALGRPSRIEAEAIRADGAITATRVGGRATRARGTAA